MANGIPNGWWRRAAFAATMIVALGGAVAVLKDYVPWAPRITLALATENTLARLDNQLITLTILEAQAKVAQDRDALRLLKAMILTLERKIKKIEKLKDRDE